MKQILFFLALLCLYSCKEPLAPKEQKLSDNSSLRKIFEGESNPSIDDALMAIHVMSMERNQSIGNIIKLLDCAEKQVFSVEIRAACILGTGLFSLSSADEGTRDSLTRRLLSFLTKEDTLLKGAVAWALAKNSSWNFIALGPGLQSIVFSSLSREGELALRKNFMKQGAPLFSDATDIARAAVSDISSSPFSIANAFFVLFYTNSAAFQESLAYYCTTNSHDLLARRCWRLLAILIQGGLSKNQLLSYTNRSGGNWLISLSGEQWEKFSIMESSYAKILSTAR